MSNPVKTVTGFIFCLVIMANANAQSMYSMSPPAQNGQSKDFIPASPSAASLGIFGQVPVGNYTGTANVSIPFYTVNYKELNIPVGISYHAAGNKPDYYPGITGLGWALASGGSITRVVKGMPDYERYEIGTQFIPVLYNPTAEADWNKIASLNTQLHSGGFFTDQDRTNPDEFYFNFNGFSGKFYMSQLSTFKVKSTGNEYFTVKGELAANKTIIMPDLPQDENNVPYGGVPKKSEIFQNQFVYKITITDAKGVKYIFGGTDHSVEFSRPGHSTTSPAKATLHNLITPTTWQLTSIESPNGYSITLNYERGCVVTKVPYSDVFRSLWFKQGSSSPQPGIPPFNVVMGEKSTLVNACYLKSITTPKETLAFTYSDASNQLHFPTDPIMYQGNTVNENAFNYYQDIYRANTESMMGKKLDAIDIKDVNNVLSKSIRFSYTNDINTRLKLLSASIFGNDYKPGPTWYFGYNTTPLPSYLSLNTDHYGYYNGHNTYINTTVAEYYLDNLDQQAFFDSKEPVLEKAQAEVLKKITYPTGGFSTFDYALNEYSSKVQTWPFTTVPVANKNSGGLRVTKITSYTAEGQEAGAKEYHYVKDFLTGGTVSSGVLAYQPTYYEMLSGNVVPPSRYATSTSAYNGTITIKHWSSNPIFPLSETRGNNVTYSEVTEVNKDGSAIVYKYKNYDNGYNDIEFPHPVGEDTKVSDNINIKQFWTEDEGISMALERGQIMSESYYEAGHVQPKSKKEYAYNDEPGRFDDNVRVLMQSWNILKRSDIPSLRITANLIYTYFPYLKKVTQTDYEPNQTDHVTVVNYEYDNEYRLVKKQETTASDGRKITMLNTYTADLATTVPYDEMKLQGKVGLLVSSEQQVNDIKITKSTTVFDKNLSPNTSLILPKLIKTQYKDKADETKVNFNQYDGKGNLVCSAPQDGIKTCYVWSYNYIYPVAKIVNADYATVVAVLGGQAAVDAFAATMPANNDVNNFLQVLRTDARLSNALVSSYTYNPLLGLSSETDPNNRKMYYEYDHVGRLSIVRDHNNNILKKICYNYAGQPENCGVAPLYDETEFLYSTSSTQVCNTGAILQVVMGYSKKEDPENPVLTLVPDQFFSDKELTTPLPDGYYRPANRQRDYYHVVGGKTGGILHICF
jgi:hypothetical protein